MVLGGVGWGWAWLLMGECWIGGSSWNAAQISSLLTNRVERSERVAS